MSDDDQKSAAEDYYPLRWKLADFAEDLFVLHRTAVVAILALFGLGLILLGYLALGDGQATTETVTDQTSGLERTASAGIDDDDAPTTTIDVASEESATSSSTTTSSAPTTTEAPTTTTTTTVPVSTRAATSPEQLAATTPGAILELTPSAIRLIGGLPDDSMADENIELAERFFPGIAVEDQQVVDASFPDPEVVTMRLSAPDLFGYNSDDLNAAYLPLIDQIAVAVAASDSISVEVSGHTDDTGPAEGNQRLSERRAASAAQRLIAQGVPSAQVTSVGRGEDQPIAPNGTEAGRLANRRVEFAITNN